MSKSMVEGNEAKLIFFFSLPIIAGNFLQQLYNTIDMVVVGNFVGEDALAAVGTCAPIVMVFIAIAIGLSAGSGIVVAQLYGAGRIEEIRCAVSTSIILMSSLGLVFSIIGGSVSRVLLTHVLMVPEDLLPHALLYFSIYCTGLVFQFTYNIINSLLRAIGDSKATLYFLMVSAIVNVILTLLFVVAFNWGIAGAAYATVASQAACATVSAVYMFKRYPFMRLKRHESVFDKTMCVHSLKLGVPTCAQQSVISIGHLALQRLVNDHGADLMSAYAASARIEQYILIPIFSFAIGMSTFAGQNIGAGRIERVKSGYKKTLAMSMCVCFTLALVAFFGAPVFIGMFGLDGTSYAKGVEYLRFVAPCFPIFALYMTTSHTLQGCGDVMFIMLATFSSLITRITSAYSLAYMTPLEYRALWISLPLGWCVAFTMVFLRYRQGKWQTKAVLY